MSEKTRALVLAFHLGRAMDVNQSRTAESGLKFASAAAKAKIWAANNLEIGSCRPISDA